SLRRRCAMRLGRRAPRGLSDRPAIDKQLRLVTESKSISPCNFSQELMRVLPIDNRQTVRGFTGLKQLRIASMRDRQWLQAQHGSRGNGMPAEFSCQRRHQRIARVELVVSTRAGLLGIEQ